MCHGVCVFFFLLPPVVMGAFCHSSLHSLSIGISYTEDARASCTWSVLRFADMSFSIDDPIHIHIYNIYICTCVGISLRAYFATLRKSDGSHRERAARQVRKSPVVPEPADLRLGCVEI